MSRTTILCENKEMIQDICAALRSYGYYAEPYDVPKENCSIAFIRRPKSDDTIVPDFIKEYVSKMSSINTSLKLVQFIADQYSKEKGDPEKHVQEYKSVEEFAKFMKLMIDTVIEQTELGGE